MNKRGKKEYCHGSDLPPPNNMSVPSLCLRIGFFGKTTPLVLIAEHVIVWHMAFAFVQMGAAGHHWPACCRDRVTNREGQDCASLTQ